MKAETEFIHWLHDAYAMERARELTLIQQRDDEKAPPIWRQQAGRHGLETRCHAEAIAACLKKLGFDTPELKTTFAKGLQRWKSARLGWMRDRHIRALLAASASEHFEIACFTALRASAARLGLEEFAATCEHIIDEDQRMGEWLESHLPKIVNAYLDRKEMEKSAAKRARDFMEFVHLKHRDY